MKKPVYNAEWPAETLCLYEHDVREIWDKSIAPHIWNQYHNQLDMYIEFSGTSPLDILDVGCAQGTLALLLAEKGHHVTAVDLRDDFLVYARSRYTHGDIRFINANVLDHEISGRYDLIFANQIIEHLVYPHKLVLAIKALLKPNGRIVITTPNADYVKNGLPTYSELGDPQQWEHLQFSADGDDHFYAYRAEELLQVMRETGLRDVRSVFFETPFISGHMKFRHLHSWVPDAILRRLDRATLGLPWLARRLSHQLLVTGVA